MRGGGVPLALTSGAIGATGSPSTGWTFNAAAIDTPDTAETIATFGVAGITDGKLVVGNSSSTDGTFVPMVTGISPGTNLAYRQVAQGTTDSGSGPLHYIESRIGSGSVATVRPLVGWYNSIAYNVLSLLPLNSGANSALSWGTQTGAAPAFTTRSNGTRLVLYNALAGASADYAFGVGSGSLWSSIPQASAAQQFEWYGGTTRLSQLNGEGRWTNTAVASNSIPVHRWTDGTVNADLFLGTGNNLQFGTGTNHTFSILQNNSVRMSFGSSSITLGTAMPLRLVETSTGSAPTSYIGGSSSYNSLAFDGNGPLLQSSANSYVLIDSNGDTTSAAFQVRKDAQTSNTSTFVWQVAEDGAQTLINGVKIITGTGSPEGVWTAPVGSTYHRSDGGAGTSFYVKESGTGNTGWVAK